MGKIRIIDTYALIGLTDSCPDENARGQVLSRFTTEVETGTLSFPDAVKVESRTYLGHGMCSVWIEAVAAHRKTGTVPNAMTMRALGLCPGLVDIDNPGVQAQPEIGALACHLLDQGHEVVLVSDDFVALSERTPLADAAALLGAAHIDVRQYVEDLGLGGLLTN